MAVTPNQARSDYERIGRAQDWQAFCAGATINRLVAKAALTGTRPFSSPVAALAGWLRACRRRLPSSVNYLGCRHQPGDGLPHGVFARVPEADAVPAYCLASVDRNGTTTCFEDFYGCWPTLGGDGS